MTVYQISQDRTKRIINGKSRWFASAKCGECGKIWDVMVQNIPKMKTCGCVNPTRSHGMSGTAIYNIWDKMKSRCGNPSDAAYESYGGRGIAVCDRWLNSFELFAVDMGPRPLGSSMDRIDNNKGYTPDNCRWVTPKEQCRNRRSNRRITVDGIEKTVAEWGEALGAARALLIYDRLSKGWSHKEAVFGKACT